jgi:hypothetical protein
MQREPCSPKRQRGAVIVLVAITGAVLIGFLGMVIDLGRLFVTKTELQNAMDACALAAAGELRPGLADPQAVVRAVNAGMTAGNRNRVGFQAAAAGITPADLWFSDRLSDNSSTFPFGYLGSGAANPATARYAMCARAEGGIPTWFMQVLKGFLGQPPAAGSVSALATATLSSSQTNCAIPIGLCKLDAAPASDPFAGLTVGQWITSKLSESATGSFDWIDFSPPQGGASELSDLIKATGSCNLPPLGPANCAGTPAPPGCVGAQGKVESLDKGWNTRFGLYKGSDSLSNATPDFSGYAYTPASWPSKFNATGGTSGLTPNFQSARASHLPYQDDLGGGYHNSSSNDLATRGADRRLGTVPVVDCTSWKGTSPQTVPVLGYACVLMLHPMTKVDKKEDLDAQEIWLEYRGRSNDPASPCSTSGLAGGGAGPLVPVLVH